MPFSPSSCSSPKKRLSTFGPIDLRQVVLVHHVQRAEAGPHETEARGGAEGQG